MADNLGEIRDELNTLLDDATEEFYTDVERDAFINSSYFEMYSRACLLNDGVGEEVSSATLTVTADTKTIALPSDFYRLVSLYYESNGSTGSTYKWDIISPVNQHRKRSEISRGSKKLTAYLRGTNLVIVPTPNWSGSVILEYVPEPTEMAIDTDEPTGVPKVHRTLIAYKAFMRLKEKEGAEPGGAAMQTYQKLDALFEADMENRQDQDSRRLAGPSGYHIYNGRI
jgi:hypothetical protein